MGLVNVSTLIIEFRMIFNVMGRDINQQIFYTIYQMNLIYINHGRNVQVHSY